MHVIDRRLLLAHLKREDVADCDDPDEVPLAHHREVADALPGHHGGAFVDRRVGSAGGDRRRHDLRDLGRGGIAPRRDHAAQDIALGEDADQPAALGHHEPPYPALAHELRRFEHGLPRLHGNDVAALLGEDILDGRHATASCWGFPRYYRANGGRAHPAPPPHAHIAEGLPRGLGPWAGARLPPPPPPPRPAARPPRG